MALELRPVREVYPEHEGRWGGPCDYGPLLRSLGAAVILQVDEGGWQGDSWVLLRDGARFGYLQFGWGSCSGCDALQGCHSFEDIEKLQRELAEAIQWFDSREQAAAWFEAHDWGGDYPNSDRDEFVRRAKRLLSSPDAYGPVPGLFDPGPDAP